MFTLYKLSLPPRRALKSFNAWLAVDYPLHILLSLLWDSVHTAVCEKSLVRIEESVFLQVVCIQSRSSLYVEYASCVGPPCSQRWRWSMFQEVGVCMGFQRRAGWFEFRALTAWGKKLLSSLAERALMLRYRLPDGRSWKRLWEGCCWFCWSIVQGKCPGWMGEGHRWSLQLCSLSAVGSCSLLHYSYQYPYQ